jgi:hypothetical protein
MYPPQAFVCFSAPHAFPPFCACVRIVRLRIFFPFGTEFFSLYWQIFWPFFQSFFCETDALCALKLAEPQFTPSSKVFCTQPTESETP